MIPDARFWELLGGFFTEDFQVMVVLSWDFPVSSLCPGLFG